MKAQMMSYVLEGVFNDNLPELVTYSWCLARPTGHTEVVQETQDKWSILMWFLHKNQTLSKACDQKREQFYSPDPCLYKKVYVLSHMSPQWCFGYLQLGSCPSYRTLYFSQGHWWNWGSLGCFCGRWSMIKCPVRWPNVQPSLHFQQTKHGKVLLMVCFQWR